MSYNGWTNYETWNVKLWLDNDQGLYDLQREWGRQYRNHPGNLADAIKDLVQESAPDLPASMYSDLLQSAIDSVNWHEIAKNILSDEDDDSETEPEEETVNA